MYCHLKDVSPVLSISIHLEKHEKQHREYYFSDDILHDFYEQLLLFLCHHHIRILMKNTNPFLGNILSLDLGENRSFCHIPVIFGWHSVSNVFKEVYTKCVELYLHWL